MLPLSSSLTSNGSTSLGSTSPVTSVVKDSYLDQNSLNSVKLMGRHNDPQALKEISKKFEAMFVQQMLKSMRDASAVFEDSEMSSQEVKFHQDMMDQQMVLNLTSGEGIGLAKCMYEQMQQAYGKKSAATDVDSTSEEMSLQQLMPQHLKPLASNARFAPQPPALISRAGIKSSVAETQDQFVAAVKPYAEKAAAELNINCDVLLAQAALETGWGKHLIHDNQGNNTFNLFNIKANSGWEGKSVGINSLEYNNGIARKERSDFRQYDNYLQSFSDYVKLLKNNPRYEKALAAGNDSGEYAEALQKAGYATDPTYAEKIKRIMDSDSIRAAVDSVNTAKKPLANGEQS